jgi:hypothetical protein
VDNQLTLNAEQWREYRDIIYNESMSRTQLFNRLADPKVDVFKECGFPESGRLNAWFYQELYDRDDIAARVVNVLPMCTWQVDPEIVEDESSTEGTEFELAVDELAKQLRPETSFYQDAEGSPLWDALLRADIMSGIGHYGIILLGLDDGRPLYEPVEGIVEEGAMPGGKQLKDGKATGDEIPQYGSPYAVYNITTNARTKTPKRKLLFLRVFPESLAQVTQWESNQASPRCGQPIMYLLSFHDPSGASSQGMPLTNQYVHWTRVVHVVDSVQSNEILHMPRLKQPLNDILSLQKVRWGGPQAFWRNGQNILSLETNPQLGGDVKVNRSELRDMMENVRLGLQKDIVLTGMTAKSVSPILVDPTPYNTNLLESICIYIPCPVRVFKGSERGELASSQDDSQWNDTVRGRQFKRATPRIIVPLHDRLINVGVLPEPTGYSVKWPSLDSLSAAEKATIGKTNTDMVTSYASGNAQSILAPIDFLSGEKFLGLSLDEAQAYLDNSATLQKEAEAQAALQAEQTGAIPAPPDGYEWDDPATPQDESAAAGEAAKAAPFGG